MDRLSQRTRLLVLVVAVVILGAAAVGYALTRRDDAVAAAGDVSLDPGPRLLVLSDRHLATVPADDPDGQRDVSGVECVRAYAAAGTGVCLRQDDPWSYSVVTLDSSLRELESFGIRGLPNRARVSASGRMVSWTAFISGESYNKGGFSTRAGILDTASDDRVMSLEEFDVTVDGHPDDAIDHNFWGVTFAADDNRFYATMSTDGRRYLVQGDFAARTLRTLTDNVECPSLSPDGTRIAFKRAVDGDPTKGWRLSVLDLATMDVTELAETRSVDDQPAWLPGNRVAYTLRDSEGTPAVWATPADGTGAPELLVDNAESPAAL